MDGESSSQTRNRLFAGGEIVARLDAWARHPVTRIFHIAVFLALIGDLVLASGAWVAEGSLRGPFKSNGGHAYVSQPIRTPLPWLLHFEPDSDGVSRLTLYEGGQQLGPAHSLHKDIRDLGMGRFSHWSGVVVFSALDNRDPNSAPSNFTYRCPVKVRGGLTWLLVSMGILLSLPYRRTVFPAWMHRAARHWTEIFRVSAIAGVHVLRSGLPILILTALAFVLRFAFLPLAWNSTDSVVITLWPLEMIPHFPWGSMLLIAMARKIFGIGTAYTIAVVTVQCLVFAVSLNYAVSYFQKRWLQGVVATLLLVQLYVLMLVGGLYTEGLGVSGLLMIVGAALRYPESRAKEQLYPPFLAGLLLCMESRYPFIVFGLLVPLLVFAHATRTRSGTEVRHGLAAIAVFAAVFVVCPVSNKLVCVSLGNSNCELPTGEAGSDFFGAALQSQDDGPRAATVARLKRYTTDPLVGLAFDVAADPSIRPRWYPIQSEMRARILRTHDLALINRAKITGELDRVTARATEIFLMHGGAALGNEVAENLWNYVYGPAIVRLFKGDWRMVFADWSNRYTATLLQQTIRTIEYVSSDPAYHELSALFPRPSEEKERMESLLRSNAIYMFDGLSNPVLVRVLFVLMLAMLLVFGRGWSRPFQLLLATALVYLLYCVGMSLTEAPALDRYRMPGTLLLTIGFVMSLGMILNSLARRTADWEGRARRRRDHVAANPLSGV